MCKNWTKRVIIEYFMCERLSLVLSVKLRKIIMN